MRSPQKVVQRMVTIFRLGWDDISFCILININCFVVECQFLMKFNGPMNKEKVKSQQLDEISQLRYFQLDRTAPRRTV